MTEPKRALIVGIGGQEAAYLSHLVLSKGYAVIGTSCDSTLVNRTGLRKLDIESSVQIVSMAQTDFRGLLQTVRGHLPDDEIYLLRSSEIRYGAGNAARAQHPTVDIDGVVDTLRISCTKPSRNRGRRPRKSAL